MSTPRSRHLRSFPIAATFLVCLLASPARAATPASGSISEAAPTTNWTGAFMQPTAGPCGTPNEATCDNYHLTIVPPSAAYGPYLVEIRLQPATVGDWDLEVYAPDGSFAKGSGNAAGVLEITFLVNPGSGVYTVTAAPFAPAIGPDTNSYSASATLKHHTYVNAVQGTDQAGFVNYAAPSPLGISAGEPSIGVNWKTGRVLIEAITQTLRVAFNDCYTPATAAWEDKSAPTSATSLDPILFTDSKTGRSVVSQLVSPNGQGVGCSLSSFSDDDGDTWIPSEGCGTPAGADHQSVGGGRYHDPLTRDENGAAYPHAVYYCSQSGVTAFCARSDDGGLSFGPGVPIYTTQCGGLHGHVKVSPSDGTVYVPNRGCQANGTANQAVVVSEDNGITWQVRVLPFSLPSSNDPSIGIAADGTAYFGYENGDGRPKVAVSHDRGLHWTDAGDVGVPFGIQNTVFPVVSAGDPDRASFSFLGTTTGGGYQAANFAGVWHLYSAQTYDGGAHWTTVDATPNDPVQRGCIWLQGGTNACRNLLDFMDSTVDAQGRVLVGYADGCIGPCASSPPNTYSSIATIARQVSGKRLFAAGDQVAPPSGCSPLARDDSATTAESTPVVVNVIANDDDGHAPPLTVVSVTQPANGAATNNGNGTVTYSPNAGFNTYGKAADTFTYTVRNGTGQTAGAAVAVKVTPFCPLAGTGSFSDTLDPKVGSYQTSSTRSVGGWEVQTDPTAHSSSHAFVALDDQPGVPTLTEKNDTLTLPSLGVSSTSTMTFWHNYDFARFGGVFVPEYHSGGVLEISNDDGAHWRNLGPYITSGGYNGSLDPSATSPLAGQSAWVGSSDGELGPGRVDAMKPVSVNLGQAIQGLYGSSQVAEALIRFRLGGTFQALIGGIQGTGWGIDDIAVTNTLQVSACPPPRPDLKVTNITTGGNQAREGDKVTVTATVKNDGTAAAGASATEFRLDNTTILGRVATPGLAKGATANVSIQWDTRSVKGSHVLSATADAALAVTESNESNNTSQLTVTVQGNKVKNGSFEQPNAAANGPDGWSGTSTGAGSATWSDGGSDGGRSAATTGNGGSAATAGSPNWTSDPISVSPGDALTLVLSVQSLGASSAANAGLVYLGAAGNVLSTVNLITAPLTTSGFAKLQQVVTIPAGVTQVRVKLTGFSPADVRTSGTVKFDEVGLFGN